MTNEILSGEINLNTPVWFRLTEQGKSILRKKFDEELEAVSEFDSLDLEISVFSNQEAHTSDDVTVMSLGEFAHIFGSNLAPGFEAVVEANSISFTPPPAV